MSQDTDKSRGRRDRIGRLKRRLQRIAEDDAKERVADPMVAIVKGILDLLEDEL
jgi:hypothetical protein